MYRIYKEFVKKSGKNAKMIIPSIIAKNQKELNDLLKRYNSYFNYFQLDIMDGKFVKNKSFDFDFKLPKNKSFEAHLMVNAPEVWAEKNYKKVQTIILNFEKVKEPLKIIRFLKSKKKKVGFALNLETSLMYIMPYLKQVDKVLLLSVHPGQYGAKFLPQVIEKIEMLRMDFKGEIEVDGHMNPETIKKCKKAGASSFVVGSFLKESENLEEAIKDLKISLK